MLDVPEDDQLLVGLKVHPDPNRKLGKPLEERLRIHSRLLENPILPHSPHDHEIAGLGQ